MIRRVLIVLAFVVVLPAWSAPAAQSCEGRRTDFRDNPPDRLTQGTFDGLDLSCQDLTGLELTQASFDGAVLDGADLSNARLTQTSFKGASLKGATFTGAEMTQTSLQGADLSGAHFAGADISTIFVDPGTKLAGADLTGVPLDEVRDADRTGTPYANATSLAPVECAVGSKHDFAATVKGISFPSRNLAGIDLSCQDLSGLSFVQGDLQGTNLNQAKLAGVEFGQADLTGASLIGADASGATFTQATLNRTQLADANLTGASFIQADLRKADAPRGRFDKANFTQAQIDEADLTGASLRGADLGVISSGGAILRDTDLTGAKRVDSLEGADLTGARGRASAGTTIVRFLVAAGVGVVIIGIVLAIVRRSRGIAADT